MGDEFLSLIVIAVVVWWYRSRIHSVARGSYAAGRRYLRRRRWR